jgi:arylsulfatase A-like enzyme
VHGDHGEAFAEHGLVGHGDVYDEVSHVPLVIHIPGASPARIDAPTSLVHIFPWLLVRGPPPVRELAEQRIRERIAPMLASTRGAMVIERLCPDGCNRISLVDARYRVIRDDMSGYVELYDLREDPTEHTNLYDGGDPVSRDFVRRLEGYDAVIARIARR